MSEQSQEKILAESPVFAGAWLSEGGDHWQLLILSAGGKKGEREGIAANILIDGFSTGSSWRGQHSRIEALSVFACILMKWRGILSVSKGLNDTDVGYHTFIHPFFTYGHYHS